MLNNKTDLFVESVIIDVPDDYDGPVDPITDPRPDPDPDDGGDDDDNDPPPPPPCEGPTCGEAEGFKFGRQNWEELR